MKKAIGLYLTSLSAVAAVVCVTAYVVNCGTDYFVNLGMNPAVLICTIAAIILEVVYLIVTRKGYKVWSDVLPVLAPVLLIVATLLIVNVRVNGIAAIMTFEGNAQTMADLTSALVGIIAGLIATIAGIIASFFDTVKE